MKEPKTIKGYINIIKKIELISPESLKGFNNLSEENKELLKLMSTDISNYINEVIL